MLLRVKHPRPARMDEGEEMQMTGSLPVGAHRLSLRSRMREKFKLMGRYWQLYLMVLPPMVTTFIWHYIPLYGVLIAFKDYDSNLGIIGGYLGLNVDLWGECTRPVNPTQYNNKQDVNVLPYLVDTYPNIRFFDADTNTRMGELRTEINSYVNETYVKFISGELEINDENLATYFQTLKDLGYEEYLQIFIDYYEAYLANK